MTDLAEIFGADTFLAPRPWEGAAGWLVGNSGSFEALTGRYVPVAGEMPVLCHRSTATALGLAMMANCGLDVARNLVPYATATEYVERVKSLAREGRRAVAVYRVPDDVVPDASAYVPSALVGRLNDKANLGETVPAEALAERTILSAPEWRSLAEQRLPLVLKVSTTQSNGGGRGVAICRSRGDVRRAVARFADADRLVVERHIDVARNDSLQFAILPKGGVRFLGGTRQLVNRRGVHVGNLFDLADPADEAILALGHRITESAAALGYRGICGYDVLTDREGRPFVVDVNFRICASTPFVLVADGLLKSRDRSAARLLTGFYRGSVEDFARAAGILMEHGDLVPLSVCDGTLTTRGAGAQFTLLALGRDAADVVRVMKRLASLGVVVKGWHPPVWMRILAALRR